MTEVSKSNANELAESWTLTNTTVPVRETRENNEMSDQSSEAVIDNGSGVDEPVQSIVSESEMRSNQSSVQQFEKSLENENDQEMINVGCGDTASGIEKKIVSINEISPMHIVLPECEFGQGDRQELGANAQPSTSSASPPSPQLSVYHVKWITWKDNKTAIITQNENGPCPLIAIMNVLILKGKVQLPPMVEMITAGQLIEYLGDCILEFAPQDISEDTQLNYEQNMHDAMAVFPKLQTGLDVNVKFTGVCDFEYTPECIIFDLLNIPLYHGWLVDPQNTTVIAAVGITSYNQLVERIITDKMSSKAEVVTNALIAESFLERTASQLTYHGLCELNAAIREDELGVLFRNNHFSMVYKHKKELFQLVTDQGFLTECNVVWETLSNIDGDGQFVDSSFKTVPPKVISCSDLPNFGPTDQQIDQDYFVALSLQEEQRRHEEQEVAWKEYKEKQLGIAENISDEELARRLQMEEREQQQQVDAGARREAPLPSYDVDRHSEGKRKNNCVIL